MTDDSPSVFDAACLLLAMREWLPLATTRATMVDAQRRFGCTDAEVPEMAVNLCIQRKMGAPAPEGPVVEWAGKALDELAERSGRMARTEVGCPR